MQGLGHLGTEIIPPVSQEEGGWQFSNVWLQNSKRRSWKVGSSHKIVGILSRPEDFLLEKSLMHVTSSSFVKGEEEMSSSAKIWVMGSASALRTGVLPSTDLASWPFVSLESLLSAE